MKLIFLKTIYAVVMLFLSGGAVWMGWNLLMPDIFKLPQITYIQAVGLVFLVHFLFSKGIE